ncbi:MAG: hypothetical protein ACO3ZY_12150 [Phycisphaerales bacterium]
MAERASTTGRSIPGAATIELGLAAGFRIVLDSSIGASGLPSTPSIVTAAMIVMAEAVMTRRDIGGGLSCGFFDESMVRLRRRASPGLEESGSIGCQLTTPAAAIAT